MNLPQTKRITINSFIEEIERSIENKNYLAVITMSLMIPDICTKYVGSKGSERYKEWFNKYVYQYKEISEEELRDKYKDGIPPIYSLKFDGHACYLLRCSILHEGTTPMSCEYLGEEKRNIVKTLELSVNSKHDKTSQYGEAKRIMKNGNLEQQTIRLNIVNLAQDIIKGCKRFLKDYELKDFNLFTMIDWDQKGDVIFIPNSKE